MVFHEVGILGNHCFLYLGQFLIKKKNYCLKYETKIDLELKLFCLLPPTSAELLSIILEPGPF